MAKFCRNSYFPILVVTEGYPPAFKGSTNTPCSYSLGRKCVHMISEFLCFIPVPQVKTQNKESKNVCQV